MRVLVTGGSGFIGSHTVDLLEKKGHTVFLGTQHIHLRKNSIQFFLNSEKWMKDCIDRYEIDSIIHLSGSASIGKSFAFPFETYKSNVEDSINLLKVLSDIKYKHIKLVLASTCEVYQLSDKSLTEESPLMPISPYGMTKTFVDCFSRSIANINSLNWTIVRTFNTIGVGQDLNYSFPSFAKQIVEMKLGKREKILKTGNIKVCRDFTDVRDVAKAYVLLCENQKETDVFNICSGTSYCLQDCIEEMIELCSLTDVKLEVDQTLLRKAEVLKFSGSNKKIYEKYGWKPEIPIDQTLNDILLDLEEKVKSGTL